MLLSLISNHYRFDSSYTYVTVDAQSTNGAQNPAMKMVKNVSYGSF